MTYNPTVDYLLFEPTGQLCLGANSFQDGFLINYFDGSGYDVEGTAGGRIIGALLPGQGMYLEWAPEDKG